ncbi:Insulysin [Lentibacillus sp. JNUCC-1]|uniref:EF-P 5-aminopentanol modification-associated protein YfmH n=1 Tax=Lentibacillus sp. JNUCC-1 TaxID=2654513 RepID=UPI0012E81796|nr:pitrilysin family protein [Lentibacillus sp. JNUCC-1]MUV38211.1 Insulysin [Lentibacillus sp. JNUCC-1]
MLSTTYENVDETIYTEVLDNGLTVCLLPRQGLSKTYGIFTTAFGATDMTFVPIGQSKKTTVPLGVAHFLEHKMFDKGDHDAFADFSKLGSAANAYTNSTETAYLFSATEKVKENVELLLDFVQDPYFTEETVEKEKGIITQEAQMYADNPDQRLYMSTLEALFEHHPVRYEVLGTLESINNITKDDLYTCYHTFYHPSNMTLCIAGQMDVEEMMDFIRANQNEKEFAPADDIQRFTPEEPKAVYESKKTISMPVSTPKCMVGIKEYSETISEDELRNRTLLTSMMLSYFFGSSGPFYKELYDEGIIDFSFGAETLSEQDYGYSLLSSNAQDPEMFAQRVKSLLLSTKTYQLDEVSFERMKKRKIGSLLRGMNSIENVAENIIWHNNRGLDYFKLIPAIEALTLEEANNFLDSWIEEDRISIVTMLPEQD